MFFTTDFKNKSKKQYLVVCFQYYEFLTCKVSVILALQKQCVVLVVSTHQHSDSKYHSCHIIFNHFSFFSEYVLGTISTIFMWV